MKGKSQKWPADRIERRPISGLVPYARNARTHSADQVAQIAASMEEWGWTNPVLIDEDGVIIAGHGRILAAQSLGYMDAPVMVAEGWTDAQKRAYVLADNKLAMNAGWDEAMLAVEFEELKVIDFDLELTGFTQDEITALTPEEIQHGLTDEDAVPELADPISKLGDVWLLGKHRVMCGDSTDAASVGVLMGESKVDMYFTDPPYGVNHEGINNDSRAGLANLLDRVFANMAAFGKPGAPVYVFHSDRCADVFHEAFRRYCHFSSMIVWIKPQLVLSQTDYQSRHEPCMYGWLSGGSHSWHADRKQTSVWEFGRENVEGHTTPKPVEMVANAIKNSSKGKQIVADFFAGSGSLLIACEQNGRVSRSMELDPKYIDVIVKRWQRFTGLKATLETTGQTFEDVTCQI